MIFEAIEKIQELAEAGVTKAEPSVMNLDPNDLRKVYLWNPHTLKIEEQTLEPASRRHTITTLDSLAGAFSRYAQGKPSVWVSLTKVVVVIDDDEHPDIGPCDRRHTLTLPIVPSPLFDTLQKLPTGQKALLGSIRHDLKPSKVSPETFEGTISKLKWETTDTTVGEFGTVKSTMGREVNSEVKSGADIPPEISIKFEPLPSLADVLQATVTVECSVVVDPGEKTVTVRPYPGQINLATCHAVEALRAKIVELLGADEKTVFAGTP